MKMRKEMLVMMMIICEFMIGLSKAQLRIGFYNKVCPNAESIVGGFVRDAAKSNSHIPAIMLRLHFHDCFVEGCDGSILIDTGDSSSERFAFGHQGVQGFDVIENAKAKLESVCPGVVSCADIVAMAARDAVAISHGPAYQVETGRKDGLVSNIRLADRMPDVRDSIQLLKQKFSEKGLNDKDLVLLSAAHTIGTTACFFMKERLYNFAEGGSFDPSINPSFLTELTSTCPKDGDVNIRLPMDHGSGETFDNQILQNIRSGFAVLESDAQLMDDPTTKGIVESYSATGSSFEADFVNSVIKMGRIGAKTSSNGNIRRATRHDDYPAQDRHIQEILNLTSCSQAYVASCVTTISRRLNRTRNWVVALKVLVLIQRLLQDGDPAYEHEIFFATRRGTRLLNMADFRDVSRSNAWDFSAFVRMYAFYLDEQLEYRMKRRQGKHSSYSREEDDEEEEEQREPESRIHEDHHNARLQHLTLLLERFLACRPSGPAKCHRIVTVALYPIVKQSFNLYYEITEILRILIYQFTELEIPESVMVYEILCRVEKQYDELDYFYDWCKSVGLARTSEYPDVERISQKKLKIMDEFIKEKSVMGQFKIEEPAAAEKEEPEKPEPEPEPDMNSVKALPGPEGSEEKQKEDKKESKRTQDVGDLLNLGDDGPKVEDHADKLAFALFDSGPASRDTTETGTRAWEAYDGSEDWETALVETPSHLSNRRPSLPGGFGTLLDGMYQQAAMQTAMAHSGILTTGSASSVAFGSIGGPARLALPPVSPSANGGGDPFSASLPVAPPTYVQMAEMEKKRRLLVEEQMMWQQYQTDALQGQVGLAKIQSNHHPYHMRGYTFPN